MNHNKITNSSEKIRQAHVLYSGANTNATKRNTTNETIDNVSNKKLRLDVGASSTCEQINKVQQKKRPESDMGESLHQVQNISLKDNATKLVTVNVNATGATRTDEIAIRNISSTNVGDIANSLNSEDLPDEYTLIRSNISDYANINESSCKSLTITNSSVNQAASAPLLETLPCSKVNSSANTFSSKDNAVSAVHSTDSTDLNAPISSASDEIELVILPSVQEAKATAMPLNIESTSQTVTSIGMRNVTSNNLVRHGTVTYSRIGTANHTTSATTVLNRVNIQSPLKNQPLMVTAKKLVSEVTQKTAKVSIGNTTISVPLLKPLNSTQLIQSSGLTGEIQKHSQSSTYASPHPQTQLNLSKILNVKRSSKGNHPTIVSLSQLQIKPVSNAKIVQAKVVSKKLPQVSPLVPSHLQANAGVVTITASKPKQNTANNINYPKMSQLTLMQEVNSSNKILENEHKVAEESPEITIISADNKQNIGINESNTANIETSLAIVAPDKNTGTDENTSTTTKLNSVSTNMPPLLTPLSKQAEQQSNTSQHHSIRPAVSIIKQNAPQLITTSATGTCVSTTAVASECNLQTELLSAKSTFSFNSSNGKLNSTPLIIPRNISLMLAKNNISQQSKTTLVTTKSVNSSEQRVKQMNLSVSNAVNISTVSLPQANCFVSQPSDSSIKQTVISVAVQPFNIMNISDQNSRKAFKISSFGQNADKRSNSINDEDQQSRLISSRIRPNLEILSSNRVCTTDNPKETLSEVTAIVKTGGSASSDALINTAFEKTNPDANLLPVPTSQAINQITLLKPEETHNVLLKQLLQNSCISHNTSQTLTSTANVSSINSVSSATPICSSHVLSARKVINVRAPSLGLVSSLEAQLARPVIPPVTAAANNRKSETQQKSQKNDSIENSTTECENDTIQNDFKIKSSIHVISKETSFVSSPNIKRNLSLDSSESAIGDGKNVPQTTNTSSIEINQNHPTEPEGKQSSEFNNDKQNIHTSPGLSTNITSTVATQIKVSTPRPVVTKNHLGDPKSINEKSISAAICSPLEKKTNNLYIQSNPADNLSNSNTTYTQEIAVTGDDLNSTNMSPKCESNLKGITDQTPKVRNTVKHLEVSTDEHAISNTFSAGSNSKPSQLIDNNFNVERSQITIDKLKSAVKDVELRKKRKREYQKHRRQLLNNNKDVTVNSVSPNLSNTKKRARKLSKIEEDYDNFINNLMAHVRQMQPLQVLEPLLNRNFGICSIYGMRSFSRVSNSKENDEKFFDQHVQSEYGSIKFMHRMALYDEKRFSGLDSAKETQPFTIQNDFYDQEFSPAIYNDEMNKLIRFNKTIREHNTETLEIINNKNEISYDRKSTIDNISENLSQFIFPGLIMNNVNNQYSSLMSPIVSFVKPFSSKKNWNLVKNELTSNFNTKDYINEELHTLRCETDSKTQTVTLSLSSSAAENIFGVLKDLANLLHITPPSTYKITKAPINLLTKQCSKGGRVKTKSSSKYIHLQNILSGRKKMCYNCGQAVGTIGIRANRNGPISTSSPMSAIRKHFCCKICYEQFKCRGNNYGVNSNTKTSVKLHQETMNSNISRFFDDMNNIERIKDNKLEQKTAQKQYFKYFADNCFYDRSQLKRITDKEITDTLLKMDITVSPQNDCVANSNFTPIEDTRQCVFCNQRGDGLTDGPSRLLNFDVDKWVHLNCALWSNGVYETISGGLMNFKGALQMGLNQSCSFCQKLGATVKCFKNRCGMVFHLSCAIKEHCAFYKNKTMHCHQHTSRTEKENELTSLAVYRRVFVDRDENRQVASVMHHSELSNLLRVGSLTFLNVGQLLPHQLESFHSVNHIYPIGYKIIRFYWSLRKPNKRCRYICSIADVAGRPEFRILVQESMENDIELRDSSLKGVWQKIVEPIAAMRKENKLIQSFPQFISGEDLFGLTEPSVVRIIESLPGIETLTDYRFKYGRNPLLELPLAINPSGAARTEQKQRQVIGWRKPQTQRTGTTCNQRIANTTTSMVAGEVACPYSKQFVHSKSSQYKKMKQEWRNNVFLARSKIQGLGLYAARDMEKHTMIIEYIGEVIRSEVSEIREKQFEAKNRGIYMFRLDEDRVVDATLSGGLARYINHACNPNCVTETVDVDRELRIIIFAKRRINRGEELSYDYKFDIEDDAHKIPCMCGAPNCRKWMN